MKNILVTLALLSVLECSAQTEREKLIFRFADSAIEATLRGDTAKVTYWINVALNVDSVLINSRTIYIGDPYPIPKVIITDTMYLLDFRKSDSALFRRQKN